MQNKKKIISLCLAFVLLFAAVGGTIAYLTDHDQAENVFTIGSIDIELKETVGVKDAADNVVADEKEIAEGGYTFSSLMPGDQITKTPVVYNTGKSAAYVRVAVVINNVQEINDAIDAVYEAKSYTAEQIQAIYDEVFAGWGVNYNKRNVDGNNDRRMWMTERTDSKVLFDGQIDMYCDMGGASNMFDVKNTFKSASETDKEGFDYSNTGYYSKATKDNERIYVFYLKLAAGESYELFNGLNVPKDFTNNTGVKGLHVENVDQMAMFEGLEINVYADAIQVQGFASPEAAFEALEAQHSLGWWN